jgi:hypothetical protein
MATKHEINQEFVKFAEDGNVQKLLQLFLTGKIIGDSFDRALEAAAKYNEITNLAFIASAGEEHLLGSSFYQALVKAAEFGHFDAVAMICLLGRDKLEGWHYTKAKRIADKAGYDLIMKQIEVWEKLHSIPR